MNYQGMILRLAQTAHRNDLSAQMPNFMNDATERINRRLTLALTLDTTQPDSTNSVLTDQPMLYYYAGLQSLYEFVNEGDNAMTANERYEDEISRYNVTSTAIHTPIIMGIPYGT